MADQSQDRNLPATPKKLEKARSEGQTPRSRDLGHFAAIAVGATALYMLGPMFSGWMKQLLVQGLRFDAANVQNTAYMGDRLVQMTAWLMWGVIPFGVLMAATGIASSLAISGWNWTLTPLMPNFGKMNPIPGVMKLVSKDSLIEALKGCGLALVLGAIGAFYLKSHIDEFAALLAVPLPAAIEQGASTMVSGVLMLLLALGAVALVDAPLQKYLHAQRLKMSHTDVKQEHKEQEGNPEIKGKIKARMREMVKRRMIAAIPTADLVVMNPTHYAVALKYEEGGMSAPRVVAKGADLLAMKIRDIARDSKVPVLQAPVLARALYAHAELDREIPAALFGAVAQVLAYVYQLRAAMSGRVAMPGNLPDLNVPAELDPHNPAAKKPTANTEFTE